MGDKHLNKCYRDSLDKQSSVRYAEKITLIGGIDPYEVTKQKLSCDPKCLPPVDYIDIVNYLVNTKSAYTYDDLKAYKSLEAYNQLCYGWVQHVNSMTVNDHVLVTARVRHSQRMNETPLKPWVITSKNGIVEAAHCNCMAGLGETCTHVGAILFYLEASARVMARRTVTQEKAYWPLPSGIDKVPYAQIRNIDFTSAATKKRRLDCVINGDEFEERSSTKLPEVPEPSEDDKADILKELFHAQSKASVLTVSKQYQKHFLPRILQDGQLPDPLVNLKDEKFIDMPGCELRQECLKLFTSLKMTQDQANNVEIITREQNNSKEWHRLRMGRITSSNMKAVCTTTISNPAISTIKAICGKTSVKCKATDYGSKYEKTALTAYTNYMSELHVNFRVTGCGLVIDPQYPFIGASPDGLVSCDCCGDGLVEIKCPYSARDITFADANIDYVKSKLKKSHRYMYQVQTQLFVTHRDYCDFVVWSKSEMSVNRIELDEDMETEILTKSTEFFKHVLLPELTGSLMSRELAAKTKSTAEETKSSTKNKSTAEETKPPTKSKTTAKQTKSSTKNKSTAEETKPPTKSKTTAKETKSPKFDQNALDVKTIQTQDNNTITSNAPLCVCKNLCTKEEKSVRCDNENCRYGLLHFQCVNLKRKPRSPYYCPECRKCMWN